jgi:hypothetical protein
MHKQRIAVLGLAVVGMVGSTLLPWFTALGQSFSGTRENFRGDGWITLGLFAVPALVALVGRWGRSHRGAGFAVLAFASLLASAVAGYDLWNYYNLRSSGTEAGAELELVNVCWGLYVTIGAGIVLVAAAFVLQGPAPRTVRKVEPAGVAAA